MTAKFPLTATATYENGRLTLEQPLDLPNGTRVEVTIGSPLDATDLAIIREIIEQDRDVFDKVKTFETTMERVLKKRNDLLRRLSE